MDAVTITAIGSAVAAIVGAWYGGGKSKENKINGSGGELPERRSDTIGRGEHMACREERKETETRLFVGQQALDGKIDVTSNKIEDMRRELGGDIKAQGAEGSSSRKAIFEKLDELTKRSYGQGG